MVKPSTTTIGSSNLGYSYTIDKKLLEQFYESQKQSVEFDKPKDSDLQRLRELYLKRKELSDKMRKLFDENLKLDQEIYSLSRKFTPEGNALKKLKE
jgi:hypothetical protein